MDVYLVYNRPGGIGNAILLDIYPTQEGAEELIKRFESPYSFNQGFIVKWKVNEGLQKPEKSSES